MNKPVRGDQAIGNEATGSKNDISICRHRLEQPASHASIEASNSKFGTRANSNQRVRRKLSQQQRLTRNGDSAQSGTVSTVATTKPAASYTYQCHYQENRDFSARHPQGPHGALGTRRQVANTGLVLVPGIWTTPAGLIEEASPRRSIRVSLSCELHYQAHVRTHGGDWLRIRVFTIHPRFHPRFHE